MEIPSDLLSDNDCKVVLQNCFKENNLKVVSYTVKSLSDKVEGFLGEHFFVTIDYKDKDNLLKSRRWFMKILNGSSKLIFQISESLNAYNKEAFFYMFLLKEFEKYGINSSFAPKCYFCKPYLLVLEDLSQRNFTSFVRGSSFLDLAHCKMGLKTLAKLHSGGILYESAKSVEQGKPYHLTENFPDMFQEMLLANDNNMARQWFKESVQGIFGLIPTISKTYNIKEEDFTKKLEKALQDNENLVEYLSQFKGTTLHGDLWFNNFLFNYNNDGVLTESVLFDYQLLKYGPPTIDVLHFLFVNTRKEFRDTYFDELVEFYYKELTDCFPKNGLNSFLPKDQYLQLFKDLQVILKLQCICDRCVTLLVDDVGAEDMANDDTLRMYLFERRSERIIDCFNKDPGFKEIIGEDMFELYNMLTGS